MTNLKDLKGKVFDKLTVIKLSHIGKNAYWHCKCSCGKETIVCSFNLTAGNSTSCGCNRIKHEDSNISIYSKWASMKHRVVSNDPRVFKSYKGKGITVCDRWKEYLNFKEDMLGSYNVHVMLHGKSNTTLERKDNDGNYSPENCCWATWLEQAGNKGNNKMKEFF